jgi:hypothetical protein
MAAVPSDVSPLPLRGEQVVHQEAAGQVPYISDAEFMRELFRLRALRAFIRETDVRLDPEGRIACNFEDLNLLQQANPTHSGRLPTLDEWESVDWRIQTLFSQMSEEARRNFLRGQIPPFLTVIVMACGLAALAAVLCAAMQFKAPTGQSQSLLLLPSYLVWLTALGGIGSVAFIGLNALSVQEDATFDLNNHRLLVMRITLGALFGIVLGLPFGFPYFLFFLGELVGPTQRPGQADAIAQAMWLVAPFVFGFSTPLVIMILNRFVDAIQAFFGKNMVARPLGTPQELASQRPRSVVVKRSVDGSPT